MTRRTHTVLGAAGLAAVLSTVPLTAYGVNRLFGPSEAGKPAPTATFAVTVHTDGSLTWADPTDQDALRLVVAPRP